MSKGSLLELERRQMHPGAPSPPGKHEQGSETWCSLPFREVEQRLLPPLLGVRRAKGQEGAGARVSGLSGGDGVGHGGVWLGWETTEER
jgi:hypothetical protein